MGPDPKTAQEIDCNKATISFQNYSVLNKEMFELKTMVFTIYDFLTFPNLSDQSIVQDEKKLSRKISKGSLITNY